MFLAKTNSILTDDIDCNSFSLTEVSKMVSSYDIYGIAIAALIFDLVSVWYRQQKSRLNELVTLSRFYNQCRKRDRLVEEI